MKHLLWLAIALLGAVACAQARASCTVPAGTSPFEFKSGQNTLRGFIDRPKAPGKHPAILILHGSGSTDVTRGDGGYLSSHDEMRAAFRRIGIATVIWDNAGNGCSEGGYALGTPIIERTDETLAAIDALAKRDDIDPTRIGLWAISLGGWIAPMAAVRRPDIAFLIIVSGPAADAQTENEYFALNRLKASGVSDAEAQSAIATLHRAYAIANAGGSRREFLAAIEPLEKYPVFGKELSITETPEMKASPAGDAAYRTTQQARDSLLRADTYLRELHQPTLAIFGGRDTQVNTRASVPAYRESFAAAGNRELTIKVFEDSGHNLYRSGPADTSRNSRFVEGYIELMTEWLQARVAK
jgi:pimeloyl-ACP methyl ester carboxylesterase